MSQVQLPERYAIGVGQCVDAGNHQLADLPHVRVVVVLSLVAARVHRQIEGWRQGPVRGHEKVVVRLTPRLAHVQEATRVEW